MRTRPGTPRALVLAASLALASAGRPALAQSTSEKAAQTAFDDGMKLLGQGKTAEACPKLEESQRLDPAMGTQFRLAECWEKLGRTASAWALFRQVVSEAQAAGREDRAAVSVARAAALEPRLTRISILVAPSARVPGLIVRHDGAVVEEALWGRGVAVDPGDHLISASAPGKTSWETQQQARSGMVEVTIPRLAPGSGAVAPEEKSPPASESPAEASGPQRSVAPGLVLGSAALAGIGAGIIFAVVANGQRDEVVTRKAAIQNVAPFNCLGTSAACTTLDNTARSAATLSNAAFWTFLGSGLAAAGAVTYLVWPTAKPTTPSATVVHVLPSVGAGGLGLSATGTF